MDKSTRFEQVPLEIVKKIVTRNGEQERPQEKNVGPQVEFEPSSKKREPYTLSVFPNQKPAQR